MNKLSYNIQNKILILKAGPSLNSQDLLKMCEEKRQDLDRFAELDYEYLDFSEVKDLDVSTETLITLAQLSVKIHSLNPQMRIVIHISTDLAFGLSRMWHAFLGDNGPRTLITREKNEACNWLSQELGRMIDLP